MGTRPQGPWAGTVLGPYTGSSVSTWDAQFPYGILGPYTGSSIPSWDPWSPHGILGPYTGSLVPTQETRSLHGILGPYTGSSVPTRDAQSLHGILGPYMGSSIPTRDPGSPHGILGPYTDSWSLHRKLCPYTGSSVPTRDARSPHGMLRLHTGCSVPARNVSSQCCNQCWNSCFPRGLCSRGAPRGVWGPQRHTRGLQTAGSTFSAWARVQGLRGCALSELPGEACLPPSLPLGHRRLPCVAMSHLPLLSHKGLDSGPIWIINILHSICRDASSR